MVCFIRKTRFRRSTPYQLVKTLIFFHWSFIEIKTATLSNDFQTAYKFCFGLSQNRGNFWLNLWQFLKVSKYFISWWLLFLLFCNALNYIQKRKIRYQVKFGVGQSIKINNQEVSLIKRCYFWQKKTTEIKVWYASTFFLERIKHLLELWH